MDSPECCLSHLPGRQGEGLRIYWGSPEQQSLLSRWNPWSTEVPYATFTEHPVKYTSEKFLEICKQLQTVLFSCSLWKKSAQTNLIP
ncbi:tumor protein p63-regulated gene 1 protein isoform X4 [Physeter macrocephalus]|uniref:Tumor protein p63-regulated gene 1 protein isoform X4 n=2 Tax=Physeter macrocephalus TaxID=9755 RepID=A0A455BW10_PHYMC|nr:tumor protein p63-regulated gene 1 protein isoform X4 [Physeter catodon]|eukprot:XP_028348006.1 tumor protein p63-regulated gene 1 protein isoform X6 [Physeter catodon]